MKGKEPKMQSSHMTEDEQIALAIQLSKNEGLNRPGTEYEQKPKFSMDDPKTTNRQDSINLEILNQGDSIPEKKRKLPSWTEPSEADLSHKINAGPKKATKTKPKKETKKKAAVQKRKPASWSDDDIELVPKKKKKKKKKGGDSDSSADIADGGPEPRSSDEDFIVADDHYSSGEEDKLADDGENKLDSEEDVGPPICKFGTSCYRNNPDHFKQFAHPWLNNK